ncbi:MAG: response regulator [Elainellaceae cyanobacterium]
MTFDFGSADESYAFFLTEAQDLLATIEQNLFNLKEDRTPAKLHSLMRAAHTLKGAAASVERNAIKKMAHVLEDVFKALYSPNARIDEDVEALLFEGYDCLRLLFQAEFTGGTVDESSALNRVATVIARLQEILGDCFNAEPAIPTSAELGFDLVESMFKSGVSIRLGHLRQVLDQGDPETIRRELQTQAEVLLGLAESLNLPGFGAIAQTTLTAIQAHPAQVMAIAQMALTDFQQGQAEVLQGDRTRGGGPSPALRQLADLSDPSEPSPPANQQGFERAESEDFEDESADELAMGALTDEAIGPLDDLPDLTDLGLEDPALVNDNLDDFGSNDNEGEPAESPSSLAPVPFPAAEPPDVVLPLTPTPLQPAPDTATKGSEVHLTQADQRPKPQPSQSVRISVEQLHRLNHTAGELLTRQTQQQREVEQLRSTTQALLNCLQGHLATLQELRTWSGQSVGASGISRAIAPSMAPHSRPLVASGQATRSLEGAAQPFWPPLSASNQREAGYDPQTFDVLELDDYSEVQALSQRALDEGAKLETLAEGLQQNLKQSQRGLQAQKQLLKDMQGGITTARTQPLGDLLNRFHRTLKQLAVTYGKQVTLDIQGSDILVDRAIVERLYDPILHLIRNAFDHGIEAPEVRRSHGKPEVGRIQIRAFSRGRYTVIEIQDDGAGIDLQTVVQRGLQLGLLTSDQLPHLSQADILDLLFYAGFSTTASISDLSGRGVGLDVVQSKMAELQGDVSIRFTRYQGTTFSLRVPLSLTIRSLLLFEAAGRTYALPSDAVERVVLPRPHQLLTDVGQPLMLQVSATQTEQDDLVQVHSLADYLHYSSISQKLAQHPFAATDGALPAGAMPAPPTAHNHHESMPILLLQFPLGRRGLQVDQVLGEQELVIRPFDATIEPPSYLHGCCTLGNRQLALVIDPIAFLSDVVTIVPRPAEGAAVARPTVSLPTAPKSGTDGNASATRQRRSPPLPASTPAAPTILVVDDSATVRQNLTATLQQLGHSVLQANDGVEAIARLQHHPEIKAVFCDIEMPRMNGYQFLNQVRTSAQFSHIPILMLTSRTSAKHRQIALELGATRYLTKPYNQQILSQVLNELSLPRSRPALL